MGCGIQQKLLEFENLQHEKITANSTENSSLPRFNSRTLSQNHITPAFTVENMSSLLLKPNLSICSINEDTQAKASISQDVNQFSINQQLERFHDISSKTISKNVSMDFGASNKSFSMNIKTQIQKLEQIGHLLNSRRVDVEYSGSAELFTGRPRGYDATIETLHE